MGRPKTQPIPSVETRRVRVADLVPAEYNPRRISARAMAGLRASLERFGELGGIVVNDRTGRIVGGHQRVKALAALGIAEVDVRVIDVDAANERAANLALNHSGIGGEWDEEMLAAVLAEVQRDLPTAFDELLLGDILEGLGAAAEPVASPTDGRYTTKIVMPIYEPKGTKPTVASLVDVGRTAGLLAEIEASSAPADVKAFLRLAAERHTVFHFGRIAEYYCHANAEVQALFEASALVLVDYEQAVERGFVAFTDAVFDIYDDEARDA